VAAIDDADETRAADASGYDAFISYAREDSDFVNRLREHLRIRGHRVWVDVEDLTGGARWAERIRRAIEACKALIFVLSGSSLASEACGQELKEAVALNKLVIPVMYRDDYQGSLPSALAETQWVFLRDADDLAVGMDRLIAALEADLPWRDAHTRLAGRAREWLDSGRDDSYLLRGADLEKAETWLAHQEGHREAPTGAHREYIAQSRRIAQAERSKALAASSLEELSNDPELSLLLACQAAREEDTQEAQQALRQALASSRVRCTMTAPIGALGWAFFTADERQVVANGAGPAYVFDAGTGRLVRTLSSFRYKRPLLGSRLSADGSRLLLLPNIGPPEVLAVSGHTPSVKLADPTDDWFVDAAITPDGRTAVAATLHTNIARSFDTVTGTVLRTWPGHPGRVALSRAGRIVALAERGSVATYDAEGATRLAVLDTPSAEYYPNIAFGPDGTLFVGTPSGVRAWDPLTGKPGPSLEGVYLSPGSPASAWPLAFDRSGAWVIGVNGSAASIWSTRTGQLRANILPKGTGRFFEAALSPDGNYAVTADTSGAAHVWATATAALLTELRAPTGGLASVGFTASGVRVLTAGGDGSARIWDAGLGLPDGRWPVPQSMHAPNGLQGRWALLSYPTGDTTLTVLDSATGRQAFSVGLSRPAWDVVLADHAPMMAVSYQDAPIEIWDLATGQSVGSLPGTDHSVENGSVVLRLAVLSADGRQIMTGDGDRLVVWDVATLRPVTYLQHHVDGDNPVTATTFGPGNRLLATIGTDGVIILWSAGDGHVIAREQTEPSPGYNASVPVRPAFSADGSLFVAAGNWDRSPAVRRTSDGHLVSKLTQTFSSVAFSPNAPLIVTDGALVWDATSGRRLLTLRDPVTGEGLWTPAFTEDGLHIIGAVNDAHEIYPCDVGGSLTQLLQLADQRITREFTATERARYLR
jgi:WD40 repeat protein